MHSGLLVCLAHVLFAVTLRAEASPPPPPGVVIHRLGTDKHHGRVVIRRSADSGRTWSEPSILAAGAWHTAPMPVIEHNGRLWRAIEDAEGGFQYVDWHFDGDDLIAACRTAWDDAEGGAHRNHDANFLTFHRWQNFRSLTREDDVPMP